MTSVDEILAGSPLSGLRRISHRGGDRKVTSVCLAERFAELDHAPADSFVVLSRAASAEITGYRLDMALRWAAINGVAAVAAFAVEEWQPAVTALDIAGPAEIALVSIPDDIDLVTLSRGVYAEIGGGAGQALARAERGLEAVQRAEAAGTGPRELAQIASQALGTPVVFAGQPSKSGVSMPVLTEGKPAGYFTAPDVGGESGIAASLVLHAGAAAAARFLDLARRARETPARSRSELLAELLMSESAINEDLLERARQLGIPVIGWHLVVRIEADDLDEAEKDEVRRFELLEAAGQAAILAVSGTGETWYLSRVTRAIVLIRVTTSDPGPQAGMRAARSAERALQAIGTRLPTLRFRAGVGTAHEGPTGLRASAAEARGALAAARAARRPAGVAAHDAVGIRRMLMEWYASDTVRSSVRDQLAPLENLGAARADTAIRTLAAYLDEQGSIVKTAERLHLHRNAVTNRLRSITELLDVDLDDPDQRLALQLACRARLLG